MLHLDNDRYTSVGAAPIERNELSWLRRRKLKKTAAEYTIISQRGNKLTIGAAPIGRQSSTLAQVMEIIKTPSITEIELLGWSSDQTEAARPLLSVLQKNNHLIRSLSLNECNLPPIDLSTLCLNSFCYMQSDLSMHNAKTLCQTIPLHLKQLTLSYNPIGDEPLQIISNLLAGPNSILLEDLQLIRCEITDVGAMALARGLRHHSLTKLAISANNITDSGVVALCSSISSSNALTDLQIGYNPFGAEGFNAISDCLTSLKTIYLHGLVARKQPLPYELPFLRAFETTRTLTELNLSFNHLGDKGAKLIGQVLKQNDSIQVLFLTNCHFGNAGAVAIAIALKHTNQKSSLQELWLSYNHFEDEGVLSLAGAVKENQQLTRLSLGGVVCGRPAALRMTEAIQHNTSLMEFNFSPSCCAAAAISDPIHQYLRLEFEYLRTSRLRNIWKEAKLNVLPLLLKQLSTKPDGSGTDLLYHTLRNKPDMFQFIR